MKLPTKFLTCLIMLCSTITFGQDFQGQAHYFSKTSIDMSNFGGRQMSEDRRKQMEERMKTMFEKSYKLTFNKTESIYKEEEALAAPGSGGGGRFSMMMGSFTAGPQYKNIDQFVSFHFQVSILILGVHLLLKIVSQKILVVV